MWGERSQGGGGFISKIRMLVLKERSIEQKHFHCTELMGVRSSKSKKTGSGGGDAGSVSGSIKEY
jgi:hypothetical protein